MNRLLMVALSVFIAGCVGKAAHPQCQNLKAGAAGSRIGAIMFGGYANAIKADIDEARYERCEEMFDLVQYQAQMQQQLQSQEQQAREQERKRLMEEKLKSPEVQQKLRNDSLKDLASCAKGEGGEKLAPDVAPVVAYACEKELDRRVDSGKVSRAKVDKMLNAGA